MTIVIVGMLIISRQTLCMYMIDSVVLEMVARHGIYVDLVLLLGSVTYLCLRVKE